MDIDAQNAYPTAMACVEDLDWEAGAIEEVFHETWLTHHTVPSPTTPFVGFVSFKFPQDVMHPCLPVVADGTLVYPARARARLARGCVDPSYGWPCSLAQRCTAKSGSSGVCSMVPMVDAACRYVMV